MISCSYGNQFANRHKILQRLLQQKQVNPSYSVLDVGGHMNNWSHPVTDVYVDLWATRPKDFAFNICDQSAWQPVLDHVHDNGKFDYVICTHTLEDICDPACVLRMLPQVAHAGVITMPTVQVEVSHVENEHWLGYIHHRHMFDYHDHRLCFAPKLQLLSALVRDQIPVPDAHTEIVFEWHTQLPFSMFMDDYLGPNAQTVITEYQAWIQRALDKCVNNPV